MGQIKGYYTCTRVKWECEDESCEHSGCVDYPQEEHGWIDMGRASRELHENRNDVRPWVDLDESDPELAEEVRDALDLLEGGYEDNGDGTFYAKENYEPSEEAWKYSFALHFSRKSLGPNGWTEQDWHPVTDGGIKL